MDEKTQDMLNNTAWQNEIADNLLIPTAEQAGIKLGSAEMLDLSQGTNISPVIANEGAFKDEKGEFSREKVIQFVQAIPQDNSGNLQIYWQYLEDNMTSEQMFSKYISLLEKSNISNPIDIKRSIADNNTTYSVSFVVKPFGFDQDSSIVVTNQDIKNYYEKNKNKFKQQASRDLSYVVFEVVPSGEDVKESEKNISNIMEEFSTTANMKNFLARNSDQPYNTFYFKENELTSLGDTISKFIPKASVGAVMPYVREDNNFVSARLMDVKLLPDSVKVAHILFQGDQVSKADSLLNVIEKGGNFEQIAQVYSADKNSGEKGGELGWMTQQYTIPGFEGIFDAKVGTVLKTETNYGVHILKVLDKTAPVKKYQVALLVKEITSSKPTYAEYYAKASDIAVKSEGSLEKFNKAVSEAGLYASPAMRVLPSAKTLANYQHTKEITKWANEHKVGEVSPVITVDNKYFFVVALTGIHEEGIATLNEIAPEIKNIVMIEKKGDKIVEETKALVANLTSIDQVAEKLGTTVSNQNGVAFSSLTSQQMDPKFIGAIAGAPEGKIMGPVKGDIGVYYFVVNGKEVGAFYSEEDAKQRKSQEFSYVISALPAIMSEGKIVDNRYKFF
jgi:PPIC-type PPIASE domain.